MENDTIIAFVLDRSGSMVPVTQATIDGFNQFLKEQQALPTRAYLSMTLFHSDYANQPVLDVRYVARDIREVPPMGHFGENAYTPGGGTPLLDAVGATVKGIEKWQSKHSHKGKVLFVILTDGEENTSQTWHIRHPADTEDAQDLLNLIRWKQNEGWEFAFMGAGGSQWLERTFGCVVTDPARYMSYANTSVGNNSAYTVLSSSVTGTRTTGATFNFAQTGSTINPNVVVGTTTGAAPVQWTYTSNAGSAIQNVSNSGYLTTSGGSTGNVLFGQGGGGGSSGIASPGTGGTSATPAKPKPRPRTPKSPGTAKRTSRTKR